MPKQPERRPRLYEELANELRAKILDGELPPGAEMPRENALMEERDLARSTVRQAFDVLRAEGLIESRQGAPVRVREYKPIIRNARKRLSTTVWGSGESIWSVDLEGRQPEVEVEVDEVEAPPRIADVLGVGRVCRRRRRFSLDGRQLMLATSYIPAEIANEAGINQPDTGNGGMYQRLAEAGHAPVEAKEQVRARMPLPDEAEALRISAASGSPVAVIARVVVDADGKPLEVNEMTLDASKYILEYDFPLQ
ncbi:GntR family transcriptional regulator [Streptomyces smyrnaeus]|uniref:GntR family transcriptional regulator n=1 Tax=Streptomyces smyrnaeus TaxID=1387713 RepID=UPI0033F3EFFF